MGLSDTEIQEIATATADKVMEHVIPRACGEKCMHAGMMFRGAISGREREKYRATVYPENVAGLVKADAFTVPHSELAMHVGAAGKEVMAWALSDDGTYAHIVYHDEKGCCRYTHGLSDEVLSHELQRITKEMLGGIRAGSAR